MYRFEADLVDVFMARLSNECMQPWGRVRTATEFFYGSGRTDVIALTEAGEIIAFEAKLTKWRDAAHQAYRNTYFAHLSYVVLPEIIAFKAFRYLPEFIRRSAGICFPTEQGIRVLWHPPKLSSPHKPLMQRAVAHITDGNTIKAASTYGSSEIDL